MRKIVVIPVEIFFPNNFPNRCPRRHRPAPPQVLRPLVLIVLANRQPRKGHVSTQQHQTMARTAPAMNSTKWT
jgi:hypothetical protein